MHANNAWHLLKVNTMSDYRDLYLKTDVLLIADVFVKYMLRILWIRSLSLF